MKEVDLSNPEVVRYIVKRFGLRMNKKLGQNFLIRRDVVDDIADAADLTEGTPVLEIGPGIGTLTQGLARELGAKNIRVNALAPGMILTEGLLAAKRMSPQLKAQLLAATPLARFGLPEDVAQVALFLASEESAWVSGERVMISGGA